MSEEKKKLLKQRERAIDFIYYAVVISAGIAVLFYVREFGGRSLSDNPEDWAIFGDFIGGTLNPIFAFFSFVLLLITLGMQRKQLDKTEEQLELNREELKLTREELKKAADAQINSAQVMNEQLKTQALQQFDNFFFNLFDQLSTRINLLIQEDDFALTYKKVFDIKTEGNRSARRVLITEDQRLSIFFIFLFHVLNTIDSQLLSDGEKKKYTNIVRSILPQQVLQLLMVACQKEDFGRDFFEYRMLIEKYSFLEHVKFYESEIDKSALLMNISSRYSKEAFGENRVFFRFSNSYFYKKFEEEGVFYNVLNQELKRVGCEEKLDKLKKQIVVSACVNSIFIFELSNTKKIVKGYLNDMEITDFRISENLLHIKTEVWLDCFEFSDSHIVWMSSGIYEGRYFDSE